MCLVSFYDQGVMPDEEHLRHGVALNPHGAGFAIQGEEVFRTLNGTYAVHAFMQARKTAPWSRAVFHARYATGDSPVTLANTQPLILSDGSVLAHNGALFPVEGEASDTRVFAAEVLPAYDLKTDLTELEQWLGRNKMVLLPALLSEDAVILNRHLGITLPDGTWHSNSDYTGVSHLAAGQCGACGTKLPGAAEASQCDDCTDAFHARRELLER